jgi:transposase-like protein
VARPSKEELEKDLSEMSYVKTGAKYGVSDNAVRKWIKQYSKLN